jgi:AraC-like DNA-binding protein
MHTFPVLRYAGNDFLAIKAILKPSVLYHLVKFPLQGITNAFINAEDIWGSDIYRVCHHLKELDELADTIAVIENFIEARIKKIKDDCHPIDKAADYILNEENDATIDWLASQSCLSVRQFIRKFEERMGISAKTFERIIRFDKAYRMKNRHPEYDWPYIAIACDYHDYQHMVRDFREFSSLTPTSLYKLEANAPERGFGFSYIT